MSEHPSFNEDEMTNIENQVIMDIATRWNISDKLVYEIMQDYT